MVLVFPVEWSGADHDLDLDDGGKQYRITAIGKTLDGTCARVNIDFYPYFFVEMPSDWSLARQKLFVSDAVTKHGALAKYSLPVKRKTLWGFTANEPRAFAQLAFPSAEAARRARYRIGKNTFEASVDPIVRFFHLRNIQPASWIDVRGSEGGPSIDVAFTDVFPGTCDARPPLVFASWDIEVYSASGKFPLADNPDDTIIQIATSFQRYGEPEPYRQLVVALDSCAPVDGVDIVAVATEADVINEWIDALRAEDVDILLG